MSKQVLEQILNKLKSMKQEQQNIKAQMNSRCDILETKVPQVQVDTTDNKKIVNRIEIGEPEDILAMLGRIDKKLDNKESDIVALNKRLFRVESTLERITNQ